MEPSKVTQSPGAGAIRIRDLSKEFETDAGVERVLEGVNADIEPGEFVTLIGVSGSGKSTLLNIISGVLEPTEGTVEFDSRTRDNDVTIGHVFQSPRLLPWETVLENIEYVHATDPNYAPDVAKQYLDMVGLSEHYDKYPSQLSGGQQQRVGIARALSIDPDILLMDEPFSNLDEITAQTLREELIDIWQDLHKTVFFITHDISEALELSDRILMLANGQIHEEYEIPLERPRERDSEEFIEHMQRATKQFYDVQ